MAYFIMKTPNKKLGSNIYLDVIHAVCMWVCECVSVLMSICSGMCERFSHISFPWFYFITYSKWYSFSVFAGSRSILIFGTFIGCEFVIILKDEDGYDVIFIAGIDAYENKYTRAKPTFSYTHIQHFDVFFRLTVINFFVECAFRAGFILIKWARVWRRRRRIRWPKKIGRNR